MGGLHGPGMSFRGSGFGGVPRAGMRWGWGSRGGAFGPGWGFRGRSFFHHRPWYYGYGGWGYAGWGEPAYSGYPLEYYPSESYLSAFNPQAAEIQQEQQAEIDRLNEEVARLRQHESRPDSSSRPDRPKSESETTRLVFGDKRTEEIRNYAIVGQTLWVFTDQTAKKVLLSDLDIPATIKANEDRGVDFHLPR
jgi:hypothetical protein